MSQDGYRAKSHAFLAQAREELAKGDSVQASEKLWGASAQMVKAVAQRRGWPHDSHRRLFETVTSLVAETGDLQLRDLFLVASSLLHVNFYEDSLPLEMVEGAVPSVERLVTKLEAL